MAETKKAVAKPVYETQESLYNKAVKKMEADKLIVQFAYKIDNYLKAAEMFDEVGDYLDAPQLAKTCRQMAEKAREDEKEDKYQKALRRKEVCLDAKDFEKLAESFEELGEYEDAGEQGAECRKKAARFHKKGKSLRIGLASAFAAIVILSVVGVRSGFHRYITANVYEFIGKYEKAEEIFTQLGDLLDSEARAQRLTDRAEKEEEEKTIQTLIKAKEGDEFRYGEHTWKVLERDNDHLLLIATQVNSSTEFYFVPFHDKQEAVTWENSSLRKWLNSYVLENYFNDEERERLLLMETPASDNEEYGISGGNSTEDYISVLSAEEAEQYMKVVKTLGSDCWLRTPGHSADTASYISANHTIMDYGYPVTTEKMAVRPIIKVDCSGLKEEAGL